jgi:HlyD family secretion protein
VTYTVEVITDNSDGKLLPFLTANAQFELSRSTNVLLVPNAALRWSPQPAQVDAKYRDIIEGPPKQAPQPPAKGRQGYLWVQDGSSVRPLKISIGPSDGTFTEVRGDELREGLEIITGEQQQAAAGDTRSPFAPPSMQRRP